MTDATPGRDRIVSFSIDGKEFAFRRPSRADSAEANRRFIIKLSLSGDAQNADMLNAYDGAGLLWEARLEVGFAPRRVKGNILDLGEKVPSNWMLDGSVTFHDVNDDEFQRVCEYLSSAVYSVGDDDEIEIIDKQLDLLKKRKEVLEAKKK